MNLRRSIFGGMPAVLAGLLSTIAFGGEILITNDNSGPNPVAAYSSTSGALLNPTFITMSGDPINITVAGSTLFVSNYNGVVGEYTTSGATVNSSFISVANPTDELGSMVVIGSNLFLADYTAGVVGEYNATTGATINASFISDNGVFGLAAVGSDLFLLNYNGGAIDEYTTSGALVTTGLVTGFSDPGYLVAIGSNLFVADEGNGVVGEYTTSGAVVNASLIAVSEPWGLTTDGTNLFVDNLGTGVVGEYNTSGGVVNADLINGPGGDSYGIAYVGTSATAPEPASFAMLGIGLAGIGLLARRRRTS
jgi:hypothetical protein